MTRNADAGVATEPCIGCANRRECADFAHPKACVAFEQYSNGEPVRMWRDAVRIPLESIGRRVLIQKHGSEAVETHWPFKRDASKFALLALTANTDAELEALARKMTRAGYHISDVARVMLKTVDEVRVMLAAGARTSSA